MEALERDYSSLLLVKHKSPCVSLYQPTLRSYPEKKQNPIRFRNLVRELELSLRRKYGSREVAAILRPFRALAGNADFWFHALDGLAVFATPDLFKAYRLQRSVRELVIVADSLHTKPLVRILQSADRYHVLGLNRRETKLFEGNRYVLDEVQLATGFPRTASDVVGVREGEPERRNRVYGPAGSGSTRHGTDLRQDEKDAETERFFRVIDDAVLERYSRPRGLPLLLAALPEHHHLFRTVSRNPFLLADAIDVHPDDLSIDELQARAWQVILPHYLARLSGIVERFGAARANGLGSADVAEIARAAVAGRVTTLLIDADRETRGRFDPVSGAIEFAPPNEPGVDDLLDDLGEHALRTGAEVVLVPAERMPTDTGIAAIYRF